MSRSWVIRARIRKTTGCREAAAGLAVAGTTLARTAAAAGTTAAVMQVLSQARRFAGVLPGHGG